MIKPGEIQKMARVVGVRDQQIEKDYILSWILQGIAFHNELFKIIVFKGGTVLKKVYFKDYRFSEDLDFTLLDDTISNQQIFDFFNEIFEYVREEVNIPLEIIDDNEHSDGGINFYISYIGPLGGMGTNKRVKVDISRSEKLQFAPTYEDVFITYTDQEEHKLLCYSLEEILVEKMRSVMQRMQARDFYDIWYLTEVHGLETDFYLNEFIAKCKTKELNPLDFFTKLEQRLPQYNARWQKSMKDQIKDLPEFEQIERETIRHLRKLKI
ncbi:MAG: nucleotidyl transferase AbiEii/AbiGii toxin family protein [Bacteroidetes bacterium]|nr:nucleotidyl transferase AbiEii/AbiGii toxin family protein [Bacteroidota bacterium]MBU1116899.1 nucleotidyl transferase AbiEii/AbiGii toxin family protein [Bacteroidota bacterium]MBU1797423.1 nucleotidyl transferase AbiEii/AbiGii toxin family protein [Bacteroidota bacterium]